MDGPKRLHSRRLGEPRALDDLQRPETQEQNREQRGREHTERSHAHEEACSADKFAFDDRDWLYQRPAREATGRQRPSSPAKGLRDDRSCSVEKVGARSWSVRPSRQPGTTTLAVAVGE